MPASSLTLVSPAVYDVIVLGRLSELLVVGAICGCACCLHTVTGCRHDNGRRSCSQLIERIQLAPGLVLLYVKPDFPWSLQSIVAMQSESLTGSHCGRLSTYDRTSFDIPLFISPKKSLKRTWDQKLSSGFMLLTLMTVYLFQFRFPVTVQFWHPSWLFNLTFFRTFNKHVPARVHDHPPLSVSLRRCCTDRLRHPTGNGDLWLTRRTVSKSHQLQYTPPFRGPSMTVHALLHSVPLASLISSVS